MRTNKIASIILAAGMALVSLTSCQERLFHFTKGEGVKFTAGSAGLWTKATYGTPDEKKVGDIVPIYWEEGDLIRIFCEECGSPEIGDPDSRFADYVVIGFERDDATQAHLAQQTETILRWGGEKEHNFYAVYPTPDVSDGISYFPSMTQHKDNLKLTASVPKTIAAAQAVDGVVKADFKYQYMVAKTSADGWSDDNIGVFLTFKPLVTAVNFTIKNGTGKQLDIVGIGLESADNKISGEFTANLKDWDASAAAYPSCVSGGTGDKVVQLSFAGYEGGHIALEEDATLNFTMFMAPCTKDVADLTFKLYKDDNTWVSTKLAYNDAEKTGVVFPNHKMTFVTGLLVPDGAQWTVKYSADVASWGNVDGGSKDPMPELKPEPFVTPWVFGNNENTDMLKYNYSLILDGQTEFDHNGTNSGISKLTITSEREIFLENPSFHTYSYLEYPVTWYLEYMDDEGNWIPAHTPKGDDDWIAGFLQLKPVNGTGEEDVDIELTPDASSFCNEIEMKVKEAATPTPMTHNEMLKSSEVRGSNQKPYNLSMYDIYGNARPDGEPVTANSYVISAPGWYAFPLVYGNGVDHNAAPAGGINTPAFNPGGELQSTPEFLPKFYNAKGGYIESPYIDQDLGATSLTDWKAFVKWKDTASDVITGCKILNQADAATNYGLTVPECSYVMFQITKENIKQGNTVIAVKDAAGIVWSWHIWVTDRDLSCDENGMMPFNLGWVDSNADDESSKLFNYEGASLKLRAKQISSGLTKEFTVTRRGGIDESLEQHQSGSSPYWQWGRKDPFVKGDETIIAAEDIAYSIQHPDEFTNTSGSWYTQTEKSGTSYLPAQYRNLWSAMNSKRSKDSIGYSNKPTKTIYDPCPPGFQVPRGVAFDKFDVDVANKFFNKAGCLYFETKKITDDGTKGYYWTAIPSTNSYGGISMRFNKTSYTKFTYNYWSNGQSIRPVKE